jgi:hypothetical protein
MAADPTETPAPATPLDDWAQWRPRAIQLIVLHAVGLGIPAALYAVGIAPRRAAVLMMLTHSMTFFFGWLGLLAHAFVRGREATRGRWDNGRLFVVGMDLFTAVSAVLGVCLWVAILVGV